jgi:hypothetical protein
MLTSQSEELQKRRATLYSTLAHFSTQPLHAPPARRTDKALLLFILPRLGMRELSVAAARLPELVQQVYDTLIAIATALPTLQDSLRDVLQAKDSLVKISGAGSFELRKCILSPFSRPPAKYRPYPGIFRAQPGRFQVTLES